MLDISTQIISVWINLDIIHPFDFIHFYPEKFGHNLKILLANEATKILHGEKKSKDSEDTKKLVSELKKFIRENKQVITSFIGLPAGTKRGVVDNSYDVSLIVTFNSKEEQEVYQNDPTHISFIDNASNLWKKVQVFD